MSGLGGPQQRYPNGKAETISPPFRASPSQDAGFDAADEFQADGPGGRPEAAGSQDWSQDLGGYNAGSLVPDRDMTQANVPIAGAGKTRKVLPKVAIGWGALILFLVLVGALFALAPKTVVSALPGTARLYALFGSPVNSLGLDIKNVTYSWQDAGGGQVLKVEGQIVNEGGEKATVPPVIVALQDASGSEVTAVTTEVKPLAPGAAAPFSAEIPAPKEPIANLQVRFGAAS